MKCPNCQFENPKGMNFCGKCGAPLPIRCSRCGTENSPGTAFCRECEKELNSAPLPDYARRSPRDYTPPFLVEKVLKSRDSLKGERKEVSVLFVDVAGFTAISERFDPETVHGMMNGCFELLGEEIHAAGGTINQYTGDGVMALFGAPIAYEDHFKRACYAALRIQHRMNAYALSMQKDFGIQFKLRMGMHMGPVVVGAIGDNLRLDYTAVGDTTNLAARLESMALPGRIWASQKLRDAARPFFQFRKAGEFKVKGKRLPVTAYALLGEKEALDRQRVSAEGIPFVNRHREWALLEDVLTSVLNGSPYFMAVEGEGGIGKTRLLEAFGASLDPEQALYLSGRCQPYGQAVAFHPFAQMLKSYFGFSDEAGFRRVVRQMRQSPAQEALASSLERVFNRFKEIREAADPKAAMSQGRQRDIFVAMREMLYALMGTGALVLTVDDMQWVDPTTQAFLTFVLQSVEKQPLLLICSGRTTRTGWCSVQPDHVITLSSLTRADALSVFNAALGTDRLEPRISKRVVSNAGGNPLFLQAMGEKLNHRKMVVCDERQCRLRFEVKDIEVPHTIRDVLSARLDALPGEGKWICQLASVIGRVFSSDVLNQITGDEAHVKQGLTVLEQEGIIEPLPAEAGRYAFRHQMMQDVAYETLLQRVRKTYHRMVAEAVEAAHKENIADRLGFLSFHFYHAGVWDKALTYTIDAGRRARQTFSCQEGLTCFTRALDILNRGDFEHPEEKRLQLHKWIGGTHFCLRDMDKARTAFQKMLSYARKEENQEAEVEALFRLGWVAFYSHRPRACEHYLIEVREKSKVRGICDIYLKAGSLLGQLYSMLGRMKAARPLLTQALDHLDAFEDREGKAWSLSFVTQYYNWIGKLEAALSVSEELKILNQSLKSPYFDLVLHFRQGLILGGLGRLKAAEQVLNGGLDHLEIGDDAFWRPRFLNTLGWIRSQAGDPEGALALNRQALTEATPTGNSETINNSRINMGENQIQMGRPDQAETILAPAMQEVGKRDMAYTRWRYKTRLFIVLAEVYRQKRERKKALYFANQGLRWARKMNAKKHEAQALAVKAGLLHRNRPNLSKKAYDQARGLAKEMGARLLLERIENSKTKSGQGGR